MCVCVSHRKRESNRRYEAIRRSDSRWERERARLSRSDNFLRDDRSEMKRRRCGGEEIDCSIRCHCRGRSGKTSDELREFRARAREEVFISGSAGARFDSGTYSEMLGWMLEFGDGVIRELVDERVSDGLPCWGWYIYGCCNLHCMPTWWICQRLIVFAMCDRFLKALKLQSKYDTTGFAIQSEIRESEWLQITQTNGTHPAYASTDLYFQSEFPIFPS